MNSHSGMTDILQRHFPWLFSGGEIDWTRYMLVVAFGMLAIVVVPYVAAVLRGFAKGDAIKLAAIAGGSSLLFLTPFTALAGFAGVGYAWFTAIAGGRR